MKLSLTKNAIKLKLFKNSLKLTMEHVECVTFSDQNEKDGTFENTFDVEDVTYYWCYF